MNHSYQLSLPQKQAKVVGFYYLVAQYSGTGTFRYTILNSSCQRPLRHGYLQPAHLQSGLQKVTFAPLWIKDGSLCLRINQVGDNNLLELFTINQVGDPILAPLYLIPSLQSS